MQTLYGDLWFEPPLSQQEMQSMRILLVEDEPEFAVSLRGTLERERDVVDHVSRLALAYAYDLVLLDRTLPD
jgi:DNA-binding response OmpR family regulator